LVKDEFMCEPRGTVNVKGKGEMEVWFVTGQRNNLI
jgi:guanylate cyclase